MTDQCAKDYGLAAVRFGGYTASKTSVLFARQAAAAVKWEAGSWIAHADRQPPPGAPRYLKAIQFMKNLADKTIDLGLGL